MRFIIRATAAAAGALTLAACGMTGGSDRGVHVVGSSTVYPFALAVAEALAKARPDLEPATIESTGSGEGITEFCAGAGLDTPDIVNASRRMSKKEFETCQANGVTEIVELQVGLDGIVFASAEQGGISMPLTPQIVYEALAANPYGKPQAATTWSAVSGSLPGRSIVVYGPPATSGTRDALKELVLKAGCTANGEMGGIQLTDEERFEAVCTGLRTDGAYVDQGEQDELTVAKVAENPGAIAIFGYSYYEENAEKVKALPVNGIEPTYETIASGQYPAARPLYIYVKKAHIDQVPALKPYLEQWAQSWGRDGPLTAIGLVAASDSMQADNKEAIAALEPMAAAGLQ